ncbi:helix-turn-helix domain-containing protein [Glutamicibacter sp. BSL13]|nr:helix-turn-helix domain-containing protein [Glutamicibacter sp. V16R2B1]
MTESPSQSLPTQADALPVYLTRAEAALLLRQRPQTLANWASTGRGPRCARVGNRVLYKRDEVLAYVEGLLSDKAAA